jgi:5'-deoxynucleotidase YfbR-like HD superfamily hydrolase
LHDDLQHSFTELFFYFFKKKTFNKRDIIFKENDKIDGVYFSFKGKFKYLKNLIYSNEEKILKLDKDIQKLRFKGKILKQCYVERFNNMYKVKDFISKIPTDKKILSGKHTNQVEVN